MNAKITAALTALEVLRVCVNNQKYLDDKSNRDETMTLIDNAASNIGVGANVGGTLRRLEDNLYAIIRCSGVSQFDTASVTAWAQRVEAIRVKFAN